MAWTLVEGNLCQCRVLILTLKLDAEHDKNIHFYPKFLLFAIFSDFHQKFKNWNFMSFCIFVTNLKISRNVKVYQINENFYNSVSTLLQKQSEKYERLKNLKKNKFEFFKIWYSCGVCWKVCHVRPLLPVCWKFL